MRKLLFLFIILSLLFLSSCSEEDTFFLPEDKVNQNPDSTEIPDSMVIVDDESTEEDVPVDDNGSENDDINQGPDTVEMPDDSPVENVSEVEFIDIPGNGGDVAPFKLAETEITNHQFVEFLNAALSDGEITVPDETSAVSRIVLDKDGNQMVNILGIRVINDHDGDGAYALWEMENPLNRSMIEYDDANEKFNVVNPATANWDVYFDAGIYPNVVDKKTDWCEFQGSAGGKEIVPFSKEIYNGDGTVKDNIIFAGHLDLDCLLPTLEEVKNWPVNHIQYYGAKGFADFYGYNLPTLDELKWAGQGGHADWNYATNDGTINPANVVSNGGNDRSDGKHKGHPQPVATFAPNPYGIYDLSGNVAEWTESEDVGNHGCRTNPADSGGGSGEPVATMLRIDGAWPRPDDMCLISACIITDITRGNDHFGFRVAKR